MDCDIKVILLKHGKINVKIIDKICKKVTLKSTCSCGLSHTHVYTDVSSHWSTRCHNKATTAPLRLSIATQQHGIQFQRTVPNLLTNSSSQEVKCVRTWNISTGDSCFNVFMQFECTTERFYIF